MKKLQKLNALFFNYRPTYIQNLHNNHDQKTQINEAYLYISKKI